ncbi:MAG: hypothetical protein V2A73_02795 [Pseudomonadota bacterium]
MKNTYWLALLPFFVLASCGGDTTTTIDGAPGADSSTLDGAPPDSSYSGDAARVDSALPDTAPITPAGQVRVQNGDKSGKGASAIFVKSGALWGEALGRSGACAAYSGDEPKGDAVAGNIDITGTAKAIRLWALGSSYRPTQILPEALFEPGAVLEIVAAGGDVPAFGGTVTGPPAVAEYTPPTKVSRSKPLPLRWKTEGSFVMWIRVIGSETGQRLVCEVPDKGSYDVPAGALGLLSSNDTYAIVELHRVGKTDVVAGEWTVHLVATTGTASAPLAFLP